MSPIVDSVPLKQFTNLECTVLD